MIENLDIVLDGVIELIKNGEINKAREKFCEARKSVLAADFYARGKKVHEIVVSINRLNKAKLMIESTINNLPEDLRFHAREAFRVVMEEINCQINTLIKHKKDLSKTKNHCFI